MDKGLKLSTGAWGEKFASVASYQRGNRMNIFRSMYFLILDFKLVEGVHTSGRQERTQAKVSTMGCFFFPTRTSMDFLPHTLDSNS